MSNPSSHITYLVPEPFEPKPLIADILRTRFCVPDSIFLVEDVDVAHTSKSRRWRAIRLILGDGELCIQALLSPAMHRFVDRGEIDFGSYVKLERFRVEWGDVSGPDPSDRSLQGNHSSNTPEPGKPPTQMVYLIVESLVVVGWNNTLIDSFPVEKLKNENDIGEGEADERTSDEPQPPPQESPSKLAPRAERVRSGSRDPEGVVRVHEPNETKTEKDGGPVETEVEVDDDFETMAVSENKTSQNRNELAKTSLAHPRRPIAVADTANLPWSSNDPTKPLKLTGLRSIPNLPYKQNWSVNVLCVISAISDLEPAGIPPYTQKQARLTDPSTDKHVLLTVFLDPQLFNPRVGSVVLLLGVKNHRFDGGSLKKYESDRQKHGDKWWYENPVQFDWCDVDSLHQWWMENA
ncbi:hypothetical protein GGS20DRAFT_124833 [Poronia punctata]|nr:hypothetical protein GGS20DRAFT_124833 [Poronia punctata]